MVDARKKAARKSLIVVIPANHWVSPERIDERMPDGPLDELEVIVACAGQPVGLGAIQAQLRSAQFLLAPSDSTADELRTLALSQAVGDVVTLVNGVPDTDGALRAERRTPPGQSAISERRTPPGQSAISDRRTPSGQSSISERKTPTGFGSVGERRTPPGQQSISERRTPTSIRSVGERRTPQSQRPVIERPPLALSVIVPVYNGAVTLARTLEAILACDLPRGSYELIVVDDASDDPSTTIAAGYADTLVRLPAYSRGAAYARNRGVEASRGELLAFVNADVCVRPDTFSRLGALLAADETLAAVGTANDGSSIGEDLAARYWNAVQQYGAERFGGRGIHFTASCGVVRRGAFVAVGMFNEWTYRRASLEGLDLGDRLQRSGYGVMLDKDIAVAHLHPHDTRSVLRTVWRHSSAVVRCLGYNRTRKLARSHRIHALGSPSGFVAVAVGVGSSVAGFLAHVPGVVPLAAVLIALGFLAGAPLQRFFSRTRGSAFALAVAPLHLAAQLVGAAGFLSGWVLRHLIGDPAPDATTQAFSEVGVTMWPPIPKKQ
jgi:GT2 family glycosyltransferase